jgi:MerR family copper efflux transcriptional regulator
MNIGDVANFSGLPAKTIRYYEDIGLVQPLRSANGYRSFRESDVHKLAFLGRARALGFTIEDCRNLLKLYADTERASAEVKQIAEEHLERIDHKITELTEMRATLAHLVDACAGDHRPDCPILADLAMAQKEDEQLQETG